LRKAPAASVASLMPSLAVSGGSLASVAEFLAASAASFAPSILSCRAGNCFRRFFLPLSIRSGVSAGEFADPEGRQG
jgi:hypothetical protein